MIRRLSRQECFVRRRILPNTKRRSNEMKETSVVNCIRICMTNSNCSFCIDGGEGGLYLSVDSTATVRSHTVWSFAVDSTICSVNPVHIHVTLLSV